MKADWEKIRQQYAPLVWSVAWRILNHHADALDCSQEVFAEAVERSQKSPVENWPAFLRWLTTKRALDLARQRLRTSALENTTAVPLTTELDPASCELDFQELKDQVRRELAQISPDQAEAFWLICVDEMSYREAAKQLRVDTHRVGVLLHRAKKYLRGKLSHLLDQSID